MWYHDHFSQIRIDGTACERTTPRPGKVDLTLVRVLQRIFHPTSADLGRGFSNTWVIVKHSLSAINDAWVKTYFLIWRRSVIINHVTNYGIHDSGPMSLDGYLPSLQIQFLGFKPGNPWPIYMKWIQPMAFKVYLPNHCCNIKSIYKM